MQHIGFKMLIEVHCMYVQWNLNFTFLESMFFLFIGPVKTSIRTKLKSFRIQVCVCAFCPVPRLYIKIEHNLGCCCHSKTFSWKLGQKLIFCFNFISPPLSLYVIILIWLQSRDSTVEPSVLPFQTLCSDEWLVMLVKVTASSTCLLKCYVSVPFWIYCELNCQTVLFFGYDLL